MAFDLSRSRNYVKSVDVGFARRAAVTEDAATQAGEIYDKAKSQAQVVGSAVFSFAQGVTEDVREAISDSALLAQLVANKKVPGDGSPLEWFKSYAEVLQNIGWTLQDSAWTDYTASGKAIEVHEKILEVLTVALAPAPAALAIATATIHALTAVNTDSSWMTIFSREAQKAKLARFQIGLVDKDPNGDVFVSLIAYILESENVITQVLLFRFKNASATFKANGAKVSINRAALSDLGPIIRGKVRAFQKDYLSGILDIPSPG
jgi:hypothetical protein